MQVHSLKTEQRTTITGPATAVRTESPTDDDVPRTSNQCTNWESPCTVPSNDDTIGRDVDSLERR